MRHMWLCWILLPSMKSWCWTGLILQGRRSSTERAPSAHLPTPPSTLGFTVSGIQVRAPATKPSLGRTQASSYKTWGAGVLGMRESVVVVDILSHLDSSMPTLFRSISDGFTFSFWNSLPHPSFPPLGFCCPLLTFLLSSWLSAMLIWPPISSTFEYHFIVFINYPR